MHFVRILFIVKHTKKDNIMNTDFTPVTIDELKNKLRNKFPQLTETDLSSTEGNENKMMRMVEYKLGKTKKEMKKIMAEL